MYVYIYYYIKGKRVYDLIGVGNVMFIKSLSYIGKYTLTSKNLIIVLNQGYNRTNMSSVKTVIDGWNDVKNRMDKVVQKLNRVFVDF